MMEARIEKAVARLLDARHTSVQFAALAADEQPRSLDEAYAIQDGLIAAWPDRIAGWKVGATSLEIQKLFGITEPVYGPVFAKTVVQSPAAVPAAAFPHRLLESEFTFRFGQRVTPRAEPYTRADIMERVDAVIPSFEIVSPRFSSFTADNIPQLVADFCANGGAALGVPCVDWRTLDLAPMPVSLSIAGQERQKGTGQLVLGNPLNVLEWFANKLTRTGRTIEAGQFVMTGATTGLHALPVGEHAVAHFGSIGKIELRFT
jgi:2-keto-4-pentenoate hydratase